MPSRPQKGGPARPRDAAVAAPPRPALGLPGLALGPAPALGTAGRVVTDGLPFLPGDASPRTPGTVPAPRPRAPRLDGVTAALPPKVVAGTVLGSRPPPTVTPPVARTGPRLPPPPRRRPVPPLPVTVVVVEVAAPTPRRPSRAPRLLSGTTPGKAAPRTGVRPTVGRPVTRLSRATATGRPTREVRPAQTVAARHATKKPATRPSGRARLPTEVVAPPPRHAPRRDGAASFPAQTVGDEVAWPSFRPRPSRPVSRGRVAARGRAAPVASPPFVGRHPIPRPANGANDKEVPPAVMRHVGGYDCDHNPPRRSPFSPIRLSDHYFWREGAIM